MSEQSTDVAVIPESERNLRGLELAERHFPPERRQQVAMFLNVPAESPALLPYLAWCASLNLSPIAGHVWLIPSKLKGVDGQEDRTIYRPAIGRDGLLHKARETKGKTGGYRGMQFNVVCERDTFEVEYTGDLMTDPKVLHRYAHKPAEFAPDESPDRYRGRIIGAWAKCAIDGEPPTFYFANLREHGRLRDVWAWNPGRNKRTPLYRAPGGGVTFDELTEVEGVTVRNPAVQEWEGAWEYTSTMVLKAAQSYVLRIGLGVTGVVPVDELRHDPSEPMNDTRPEPSVFADALVVPDFDFAALDVPEELRERLQHAIAAANELEPFSWGPAKCQMVLTGRSAEELAALAAQIEVENERREQRIAHRAGEDAGPIADAEVVTPERELSDEERAHVDVLMHRLANLDAARDDAAPASDEMGQIVAEMDQVESELRQLGVDPNAGA